MTLLPANDSTASPMLNPIHTARQQERNVTLRLRERAETFLVGEFEVAPQR